MKKIATILIVLSLIIFLFPYLKKSFEKDEYQIKFQCYEHDKEISTLFNRHFRIIPSEYEDKYELTLVLDSINYKLYRVDDLIYGVPNHYYLIKYIHSNKIADLMSYHNVEEAVRKGIIRTDEIDKFWENLINLVEFNKIYRLHSTSDKMTDYCELLRTSLSPDTYSMVSSDEDIEKILEERPKSEGTIIELVKDSISDGFKESDITIKDYSFLEKNSSNVCYYWYFDLGLMKFDFTFNAKNEISSVKITDIGYVGNEIQHL